MKKVANYNRIYKRIDVPKIKNFLPDDKIRYSSVKNYITNQNKNIDYMNIRAGVIPYTKIDNKIFFAFGVDTIYGDLTDFGGGVQKADRSVINGGIREFREESLGIFDPICDRDIYNHYVIYGKKILVLLINYQVDPQAIIDNFKNKLLYIQTPEVKDVVWLSKEEIIDSLSGKGKRIYSRVRHLLKNSKELWYNL